MLIVFFKSIITFVLVLVFIRIMGKRQLSQMQPFELVITLIIAEVACIPMNDPSIPLYNGIIPIITLVLLHFLISFLARKSLYLRKLISGSSIIVVDKDGINYKNLVRMNMNVNDLIEMVRSNDYADFSCIQYAIFETNGVISIIPKKDADTMKTDYLPISLIVDGKWIEDNLRLAQLTKPQVIKKLNSLGLHELKKILLLDMKQDGSFYVQPQNAKYIMSDIKIDGGDNW